MYFRNGYLVIRRAPSPPFLFHWSMLLLPLVASGFRFQPGTWLAVWVIIFVHELGHAVAVWRARAQVTAIHMDGTGGYCEWTGHVTLPQRALIYWGGILAQLLLLVTAIVTSLIVSPTLPPFAAQFLSAMLLWNVINMVFNLLPIPPLDGHEAWPLLKRVWLRWRSRQQHQAAERQLTRMTRQQMGEMDRLAATTPPQQELKAAVSEIFRRAAEEHKTGRDTKQTEVNDK